MQALHLAVTVSSSNTTAMDLYLSLDFRRFTPAIPIATDSPPGRLTLSMMQNVHIRY
ncbi:MAG: hypothetical protein NVSMB43_09980 [Pseudarthrobacter sp.]